MEFAVLLLLVIILAFLIYYYQFPQKDTIDTAGIPRSYMIESPNRIDIQSSFECAAFSSAFLLRHFGIGADGNELYMNYPKKLPGGIIAPKGIIKFFRDSGYKVTFCRGNINTFKKQISRGIPVIAYIKVFPGKRYLHFVPVVGYDEEYLYFADSLKFTINCNEKYYNRKTSVNDFMEIWRTGIPFYENTYIIVNK